MARTAGLHAASPAMTAATPGESTAQPRAAVRNAAPELPPGEAAAAERVPPDPEVLRKVRDALLRLA
jgi:hypothetical protein